MKSFFRVPQRVMIPPVVAGGERFSRFHVIEYDAISDHPEVIRRFPVISHV
jgi:hypothetical protein